ADGAENKKFHAGRAAESGILAAVLAGAGMSGPGHILEAEDGGLYPATSDDYRLEAVTEELGRRFLISEVSVKPFACCRSMHPAIDAAIQLRRRHGIDPVRIKRVVVGTYAVAVRQCGFTKQPKSTAEAQFSLPYGIAAALADGNALLDQFSESRIRDGELLELAGRVELTVDPEMDRLYPNKWGCRLRIEMSDGNMLAGEVTAAKGDPENPLSGQEMKDKFIWLAQGAVGTARSNLMVELVDNLDKLDTVLPLTRLLSCE
ncbi:MAG: MmgE/PrpD family protein, partial [Eubacteriales bacterium]